MLDGGRTQFLRRRRAHSQRLTAGARPFRPFGGCWLRGVAGRRSRALTPAAGHPSGANDTVCSRCPRHCSAPALVPLADTNGQRAGQHGHCAEHAAHDANQHAPDVTIRLCSEISPRHRACVGTAGRGGSWHCRRRARGVLVAQHRHESKWRMHDRGTLPSVLCYGFPAFKSGGRRLPGPPYHPDRDTYSDGVILLSIS